MTQESKFNRLSHEIADGFIQSIIFIDDQAYISNEDSDALARNDFDALTISQIFSKKRKICAVYGPENESDIENLSEIACKADVAILDWQMNIECVNNENEDNLEQDDEDEDTRGKYTKKIILRLLENKDSLKLIVVYTGEVNLLDIAEEIYQLLPEDIKDEFNLSDDGCAIKSSNMKIIVRSKSNSNDDPKFKHNPQLQSQVIPYEELPDAILMEFSEMTAGILPNIALQALTAIRNNTDKIIGLFSKDLDAAYLGHKAQIPQPTDAEPFLIELFVDMLLDLLSYQGIAQKAHEDLIPKWIDQNIKGRKSIICNKRGGKPEITSDFLKDVILMRNEEALDKFLNEADYSNKEKNSFKNKSFSRLFLNEEELDRVDEKDIKFAKLTQHKSLFLPKNIEPFLSLGVVINHLDSNDYFLCIQQTCDSTRIDNAEERRFLFLPLEKKEEKFDIITTDNIKLKLEKKTYSLRTIKFKANNRQMVVAEKKDNGDYFFKDIHNELYKWIVDIKSLQAQKIAVDYASSLARVGVNQSEWLRRKAN